MYCPRSSGWVQLFLESTIHFLSPLQILASGEWRGLVLLDYT